MPELQGDAGAGPPQPSDQAAPAPSPLVGPWALPAPGLALPATSQGGPPRALGPAPAVTLKGRELKVEDALMYLDQVKAQFGDQLQIYNEFLDIMKGFKAQSIDTSGVIERVSTLFRGHDNIILGFNTFLPPGYEIEPSDIEHMNREYDAKVAREQAGGKAAAPPSSVAPKPAGPAGPAPSCVPIEVVEAEGPSSSHFAQNSAGQGPVSQVAGPVGKDMNGVPAKAEFDHAINYVTTIKRRFADHPQTYKTFLEILHTYQKEQRGVKEVLEQVSELFADHPDLLREFTYFLPDQVQGQARERLHRAASECEAREARRKAPVE